MATKISGYVGTSIVTLRLAFSCALIAVVLPCAAETTNLAALAQRTYEQAAAARAKNPTNAAYAVELSRMAYEWAEFASRDELRAQLANEGIAAARAAIALEKTNAGAHYWLGMNYGQLARTRWLGALPLVRDMVGTFTRARELDPKVDYAGPDRSLGLLYREAPGWPTSVGDKQKSRAHLERAVKLAPEFPENHLSLLESYEKWGDRRAFEKQLPKLEESLAKGRKLYVGEEWEWEWIDWKRRHEAMKAKAGGVGAVTLPKGAVRQPSK